MERKLDKVGRITSNPEILTGKPTIRGTRISVEFVLDLLASGMSNEEIVQEYPHLEKADIQAAVDYAARILKNEEILTVNLK